MPGSGGGVSWSSPWVNSGGREQSEPMGDARIASEHVLPAQASRRKRGAHQPRGARGGVQARGACLAGRRPLRPLVLGEQEAPFDRLLFYCRALFPFGRDLPVLLCSATGSLALLRTPHPVDVGVVHPSTPTSSPCVQQATGWATSVHLSTWARAPLLRTCPRTSQATARGAPASLPGAAPSGPATRGLSWGLGEPPLAPRLRRPATRASDPAQRTQRGDGSAPIERQWTNSSWHTFSQQNSPPTLHIWQLAMHVTSCTEKERRIHRDARNFVGSQRGESTLLPWPTPRAQLAKQAQGSLGCARASVGNSRPGV